MDRSAADTKSSGMSQMDVGRMVDSSQADDRRMIRLVRERPLLFARTNMPVASYYSQVKRLWKEVADVMGWTVADVRRKWSHIRNSYSRHLRNEMHGACTSKGRMVSKWYLADELQFLREHMATDTRPSQTSRSLSYVPKYLDIDVERDVKPFAQSTGATPPWCLDVPRATPRPPAFNDDSSGSHTFEPDENSAYFQFFRGIYKDYQELAPRKQRLFRRQCLIFLHHLVDDEDLDGSYEEQSDAMNLSNPASEEEREQKVCVIENVESYNNVSPH